MWGEGRLDISQANAYLHRIFRRLGLSVEGALREAHGEFAQDRSQALRRPLLWRLRLPHFSMS